jgi:argininosuccinate lyase
MTSVVKIVVIPVTVCRTGVLINAMFAIFSRRFVVALTSAAGIIAVHIARIAFSAMLHTSKSASSAVSVIATYFKNARMIGTKPNPLPRLVFFRAFYFV